nr:hypothetical protein Iba_chr02aCG2130 [Ipomoea batatas]
MMKWHPEELGEQKAIDRQMMHHRAQFDLHENNQPIEAQVKKLKLLAVTECFPKFSHEEILGQVNHHQSLTVAPTAEQLSFKNCSGSPNHLQTRNISNLCRDRAIIEVKIITRRGQFCSRRSVGKNIPHQAKTQKSYSLPDPKPQASPYPKYPQMQGNLHRESEGLAAVYTTSRHAGGLESSNLRSVGVRGRRRKGLRTGSGVSRTWWLWSFNEPFHLRHIRHFHIFRITIRCCRKRRKRGGEALSLTKLPHIRKTPIVDMDTKQRFIRGAAPILVRPGFFGEDRGRNSLRIVARREVSASPRRRLQGRGVRRGQGVVGERKLTG